MNSHRKEALQPAGCRHRGRTRTVGVCHVLVLKPGPALKVRAGTITVAHLPPGTSKWNCIEHRRFEFVTQTWKGKPLLTHQVIVQLIASTATQTGLTVQCRQDETDYEKGTKLSDEQIASLHIQPAEFHGEWNYTIAPHKMPN